MRQELFLQYAFTYATHHKYVICIFGESECDKKESPSKKHVLTVMVIDEADEEKNDWAIIQDLSYGHRLLMLTNSLYA